MLIKTILRLLNRFLSFVATDGKDWDKLKPTLYLLSFYKAKDLPSSQHHLNSKTNSPVLLIKIVFRHWPVAKDSQEGDGLKPAFSSFNAKCKNHRNIVMDSVPWWNQIDIYLIKFLTEHSFIAQIDLKHSPLNNVRFRKLLFREAISEKKCDEQHL